MQWQALQRQLLGEITTDAAPDAERALVYVDSAKQQLLHLHPDKALNKTYPISTSSKGVGNQLDSFKTPAGIHCVQQKIGAGQPLGMVFKGRVATGKISHFEPDPDDDEITSRILWLAGLQPGINQGGDCDSYARYIYIHGTSDELRIGEPVSAGCIRMKNQHVIEFFDQVEEGDLVFIC